jgi:hypothetical protein
MKSSKEALILLASMISKYQQSDILFNSQIETKDQKSSMHIENGRKWQEINLRNQAILHEPLFCGFSVARILLAWIQVIRKQIKSAVMLSDFEMMVLCREHDSHSLGQS